MIAKDRTEAVRKEMRCRRKSHLWDARAHLYALASCRLDGTADMPVESGCGATFELHYRSLIQSSRDLARQILAVWP